MSKTELDEFFNKWIKEKTGKSLGSLRKISKEDATKLIAID